jgi:ABC-type antimicrobial peptide transport system ATPase subunit
MQKFFPDPYMSLDPRQKNSDCHAKWLTSTIWAIVTRKGGQGDEHPGTEGLMAEHFYRNPNESPVGHVSGSACPCLDPQPQFIVRDEPVPRLDVSPSFADHQLLHDLQEKDHLTYLCHRPHITGEVYLQPDRRDVLGTWCKKDDGFPDRQSDVFRTPGVLPPYRSPTPMKSASG